MNPTETSTTRKTEHVARAAVFLDRDGTIIEDRGDLRDPSQVVFFRDTVSSLRSLCDRFDLFIVTNQSGVAKGTIPMQAPGLVNSHITSFLAQHGIPIAETYVCPHERADGCHCIKPKPHFLKKAERTFGIDLRRSFVVGDHPHDVELAKNVGATGIYVLTGHGLHHGAEELPSDTVVANGIADAAEQILARAVHEEM